jgi:PTH2 family peptidyl-tRNA hydrolase
MQPRAVELPSKIIFITKPKHSTTTLAIMAAPVPLDRLPPTTTAYVIATAIIAGVTGYFIGQGSSLNLFKEKEGWPNSYDVEVHNHSSDEGEEDSEEEETDEEDEGNGEELASFKHNTEEVKLVLVVRMDLGMTKGMRSTNNYRHACTC